MPSCLKEELNSAALLPCCCWMTSQMLFVFTIAIIYASFFQKSVMKWYGMSRAYFFGLAVFTLCMMGTLLSKNLVFINILAALSGTGFATITTIPYMLVSAYHNEPEVSVVLLW